MFRAPIEAFEITHRAFGALLIDGHLQLLGPPSISGHRTVISPCYTDASVEFPQGLMMSYVHHVRGRLRVRSRHLKGDRIAAQAICDALRSIEGVTEAVANPSTGSITVRYEHRRVAMATIWQVLHQEGVVASASPAIVEGDEGSVVRVNGEGPTPAQRLVDALVGLVVDKVLERSTLALLAALV